MLARHADHVHDDAFALFQVRIELAREVDEAEDLELPGVTPFRFVEALDRAAGNVAGVVDEDVHVAAFLGKLTQCRPIAQIDRMGGDIAAQIALCFLQPLRVPGRQMDPAAFRDERLGAGQPDAFGATGDEN